MKIANFPENFEFPFKIISKKKKVQNEEKKQTVKFDTRNDTK